MDTRTSPIALRLARAREALVAAGAHALLVPSADPHLSEYLPQRWAAREWLSGFTGSVGTLVVTRTDAQLFADSRYWTQAEAELQGSGIALFKIPTGAALHHIDWLAQNLQAGQTVMVDGQVLGLGLAQMLRQALSAKNIRLRTDADLLESFWSDRPGLPADAVYEHLAPHATSTRADKLAQVRAALQAKGVSHHLISSVDDVAWVLNLRGSDVPCNPVFIAHLLLDAQQAQLFVAEGKIPAALAQKLAADGVQLRPYEAARAALGALDAGATLLVDPRRVTLGLREAAACKVVEAINPSTLLKSRKSDAEAAHIRRAMEEDGAAMCHFYAWFEAALGQERITELTVDERLSAERARRAGFVGLSFPTIAGFNANGAMPHYRATEASHAVIEGDGLLLIDSGGQYLGGTTDITRVWAIGAVTPAQKRDYTLVLKGTIALSRAVFPRGTLGPMLDALARAPMWAHGLDFGHGTGHGVGYFMNVHEGPQNISKAIPDANMAMEVGMITSIEPGVYRPGQWGVRIENLVLNTPQATPEGGAFGEMLAFETLTLCPIDTRCIDLALLGEDDRAWLNHYHAEVRRRLAPLVDGAALAWLELRTQPL
ncbi:aminopeptidase P family protein [Roseateles sp. BYS180W]|uniref:Aminopeptidase P family protein n=1 Tax=Roseateles rivi TaxID=3299028 RepID=A0ABW7FYZ2_9BURK